MVNLPMLDSMYREYPLGEAPEQLQRFASKIRDDNRHPEQPLADRRSPDALIFVRNAG
jgi:hypothetical protein